VKVAHGWFGEASGEQYCVPESWEMGGATENVRNHTANADDVRSSSQIAGALRITCTAALCNQAEPTVFTAVERGVLPRSDRETNSSLYFVQLMCLDVGASNPIRRKDVDVRDLRVCE